MTKKDRAELKYLADRIYAESTRVQAEAATGGDYRIVVDCRVLDRLVELLDKAVTPPIRAQKSKTKLSKDYEDDIFELEEKLKKYQTLPVLSF